GTVPLLLIPACWRTQKPEGSSCLWTRFLPTPVPSAPNREAVTAPLTDSAVCCCGNGAARNSPTAWMKQEPSGVLEEERLTRSTAGGNFRKTAIPLWLGKESFCT